MLDPIQVQGIKAFCRNSVNARTSSDKKVSKIGINNLQILSVGLSFCSKKNFELLKVSRIPHEIKRNVKPKLVFFDLDSKSGSIKSENGEVKQIKNGGVEYKRNDDLAKAFQFLVLRL